MKIKSISPFSLVAAVAGCLVMAAFSVMLAFPGSDRASAIMDTAVSKAALATVALWMIVLAIRSAKARCIHSFVMHTACALILVGHLVARILPPDVRYPMGVMRLEDGDCSSEVSDASGTVRRIPFEIRLEKFFVKRYAHVNAIRQYHSRIAVLEPGKPERWVDVTVNNPARIAGYWIYQDSWGRNPATGKVCTFLKFSRPRAWSVILSGYCLLGLGPVFYAFSVFRRNSQPAEAVKA